MSSQMRQRPVACPQCGSSAEYKGRMFRTLDEDVFECRICGSVLDLG